MDSDALTTALKGEARRLGFALSGACPAAPPPGVTRFQQWLDAGYAGEMHYLPDRADAYRHPEHVLDGARSLLMLAMHYRTAEPAQEQLGQGRISRYAWGDDYHDLIRARLNELAEILRQLRPDALVRGVVDTAPLFEREFAQLAGLGWIGKNTLLLNKHAGSWFFLAALLTDQLLSYDAAQEADHCGTCRACLDACPTGAFVDAYVLDARRCISYLTIELRGPVPADLRPGLGNWLFGCDVCQDVCPWNGRAPESAEDTFQPAPGSNPVDLVELFALDEAAFRARFRHSPLWRPKRRGLLRSAAIVLGNQRHLPAVPALARGLGDAEPLVRGACAWALGQIGTPEACDALSAAAAREEDATVKAEIATAIAATIST